MPSLSHACWLCWLLLPALYCASPTPPVVASVWETALGSRRRLTQLPDQPATPGLAPSVAPGHPTLILDAVQSEKSQQIIGFGGAFTEAAAVALSGASPLQQQQVCFPLSSRSELIPLQLISLA